MFRDFLTTRKFDDPLFHCTMYTQEVKSDTKQLHLYLLFID